MADRGMLGNRRSGREALDRLRETEALGGAQIPAVEGEQLKSLKAAAAATRREHPSEDRRRHADTHIERPDTDTANLALSR